MCFVFVLKLKTADEMRISDWSSDVFSSDLLAFGFVGKAFVQPAGDHKPEDSVAKEFQPLVIGLAVARMGERVGQQFFIREPMVERGFRPFQEIAQNVRPNRSQDRKSTSLNSSH